MNIDELHGLSSRARNVLRCHGYHTVGDLRAAGPTRLAAHDYMGPLTVREIGKAIGGWDAEVPTEVARKRYEQAKRRYNRAFAALTQAKAALKALTHPPPAVLTVEDIVGRLREQLERHCTGYVVDDVLRVKISTRNANWVELEVNMAGYWNWTSMPLDQVFREYINQAMAELVEHIAEVEASDAAPIDAPWRAHAPPDPDAQIAAMNGAGQT